MFVSTALIIALFSINFAWTQKNCGDDCVPVRDCLEASAYLSDVTVEKITHARQSYCGYSNIKGMLVCCSDFKIVNVPIHQSRFGESKSVPPTSTTTSTTTPKPEVKEHPNMKLLPDTCGEIDEDRVINGQIAYIYEFPWMALISYRIGSGLEFKCSGTLINSQYVLTAAHCVVDTYKIAGVRIGEYDIRSTIDCQNNVCESNVQDRLVVEVIAHQKYNAYPKYENDIALLRLEPSINLSYKNAGTICLPVTQELRNTTLERKIGKVAGWGLTEHNKKSSVLLKVDIPVRTTDECEEFYSHMSGTDSTQFCAGELNKDSCRGDSGGPLIIGDHYKNSLKYIQFGIVSNGPWECGSGTPGIYTDVRKYTDWILDHIKE